MNETFAPMEPRPSGLGRFFTGFKSGALSGGLMMGIYGLLSVASILSFPGFAAAGGIILATSLFSGTMSVIRGAKSPVHAPEPIVSQARSQRGVQSPSLELEQEVAMEQGADESASKWQDSVGKRSNRMSEILANGSMSDKDRAAAILAERQQAATTQPSL